MALKNDGALPRDFRLLLGPCAFNGEPLPRARAMQPDAARRRLAGIGACVWSRRADAAHAWRERVGEAKTWNAAAQANTPRGRFGGDG